MFKRLKELHFRFGIMACANDIEERIARSVIEESGGKIVRNDSLRSKYLIKTMLSPAYQEAAKTIFVVRGKDVHHVVDMLNEFQKRTNGFLISYSPEAMDLVKEGMA